MNIDDEPGRLAALEEALEIVKADLRASGLPDSVRLFTWEGSPNAGVKAWAGNSSGVGISPAAGKEPVTALPTTPSQKRKRAPIRWHDGWTQFRTLLRRS